MGEEDTEVICIDEAHFTIDADRRCVWAKKGTQPVCYTNGSKKAINIGGAYTSSRKFHYEEMERQCKEEVKPFIKRLHRKYKKAGKKSLFVLDKATWHKANMVIGYIKEQEDAEYLFFPTGASDRNPVEQCWDQTREAKTANISHDSEKDLRRDLKGFWKSQPFTFSVFSYLMP